MDTKHSKITAIETPDIAYFDLADLYLSDLNPRQDVDDDEISLLAQSLVACGLIQNLSGLLDKNGKVGIVAGGRRLRALQIAVHEEPNLSQVPVKLAVDAHMAETWANVEYAVRADLHPADEIRAFGKMYQKSLGVPRIAKVFGVTEKHVYRRLALVNLPSPVLDALKSGEINMTMAAAFTLVSPAQISSACRPAPQGRSKKKIIMWTPAMFFSILKAGPIAWREDARCGGLALWGRRCALMANRPFICVIFTKGLLHETTDPDTPR